MLAPAAALIYGQRAGILSRPGRFSPAFFCQSPICRSAPVLVDQLAVPKEANVNAMKILGIVLIVGGILGLVYGGFSYTKETHETKIGPLVLSVADKETVNVPIWVGVGTIVIGGLLLVFGNKKS